MIIHSPIISGSLTFADGATVSYPDGGEYSGSFSGSLQVSEVTSHIIPDAANTYDLGSSTNFFRDLYISTGSLKGMSSGGTVAFKLSSKAGGGLKVTDDDDNEVEIIAKEITLKDTSGNGNNIKLKVENGALKSKKVNNNQQEQSETSQTANSDISGSLVVSGSSTLSNTTVGGTLDTTGLASLDGGIDVDGAFTVANSTGNVSTTGTLSAGATTLTSTVDVTGLASLDGGIDVDGAFTVANSSGNVSTTGTLSAGNTDVATLDASGLASLDGGIDVDGAFTVANTSGNVSTSGTLNAGATTVSSLTLGSTAITATGAELNILDGATVSAAELNLLDDVTGLVKADFTKLAGVDASAAELNILDGATVTSSELNILDGATVTTSELNILDGVTATTAELNYVDGVTSNIQTQLDNLSGTDIGLTIDGDASGTATFTNLGDATLTLTISDDSHNHVISNVDGLQDALNLKAPLASPALTGNPTAPTQTSTNDSTRLATTAFVQTRVSELIGNAGSTLDTLGELSASLADDQDALSSLTTTVGGKLQKDQNLSDLTNSATALTNLGLTATAAELNKLDGATVTTAEINILDGVTATATELNILDGVTATTAELNKLDGVTATTTELNYVDGVTSNIQTQLDGKQASGTYNTIIGTDTDLDTTGAQVVDQINVTDGVIQSMSKRTMTLADLGYTGATNANNITNNNQLTNGAGYTTYSANQTLNNNSNVHFEGLMVGQTSGATGNTIRCVGDIVAYYSDDRLKIKLGNLENALDKVNSLNGFTYKPNEAALALGVDQDEVRVGVSAQEVQAVLPEAVKDAPVENTEGYLTVQYEKIVPLLIESIKELSAKVAELESK